MREIRGPHRRELPAVRQMLFGEYPSLEEIVAYMGELEERINKGL